MPEKKGSIASSVPSAKTYNARFFAIQINDILQKEGIECIQMPLMTTAIWYPFNKLRQSCPIIV